MLLGRHMPLGGHALQVPITAREIGCDAAQIFLTNPRGWRVPTLDACPGGCVSQGGGRAEDRGAGSPCNLPHQSGFAAPGYLRAVNDPAHCYARASSEVWLPSVVFHVGSHGGSGEEAGLERLTRALPAF